jgi:hypothetical protein
MMISFEKNIFQNMTNNYNSVINQILKEEGDQADFNGLPLLEKKEHPVSGSGECNDF